jgi:hypothetical protein
MGCLRFSEVDVDSRIALFQPKMTEGFVDSINHPIVNRIQTAGILFAVIKPCDMIRN